ncbi:MAG: bifunctional riboflavin kinase/FMN adenylyltransferase [Chloroflexi bacterium]|nr:bifunctional riboflavin kinase/FMN adenylyltransferase [Chloroflexota bacterium]
MSKIVINNLGKLHGDTAITIGVFDGVHMGHRYLINQLMKNANTNKLSAGIVTFDPHPIQILRPDIDFKYLQSLESRVNRLQQTGVDFISIIKFDKLLSEFSAQEFIKELQDQLNFKLLVIGEDFRLGKNQEGDLIRLRDIAHKLEFSIEDIPLKSNNETKFSSSQIRKFITKGDIKEANKILGTSFTIDGKVDSGEKRGRQLGFPTINLSLNPDLIAPKKGVYASFTKVDGTEYKSIVNIGTRPTFGIDKILAESHLFDYNGNAYDKEVTISLLEFIREEVQFDNKDQLINQINHDIKEVKRILH